MPFKNYDELAQVIESRHGVMTCLMQELRDAHGAGKLGVNVVANISDALEHRGLGHFPDPLPVNQWEKARIYRRGTPVGDVIRAVLAVDDEKSDDVLRSIAGNTGNDIIKKIRELVCD